MPEIFRYLVHLLIEFYVYLIDIVPYSVTIVVMQFYPSLVYGNRILRHQDYLIDTGVKIRVLLVGASRAPCLLGALIRFYGPWSGVEMTNTFSITMF